MLIFNAKQDYLKSGSLLIITRFSEVRSARFHIKFEVDFKNDNNNDISYTALIYPILNSSLRFTLPRCIMKQCATRNCKSSSHPVQKLRY